VRQGNLVKANSEPPLVVINQIQPILVRFSVPQSQFPDIQRYYRGGNALLVRATPSEGSGVALSGTLAFVDNNVDSTTGTVLLKARFANPEGSLWPGQYTNVELQLYVDANALTLPVPAVMTGQQGTYVYTIDSAGGAKQNPVQVSRTVDSLSVISSGVKEGEQVVVDGQSRLVPGSKVSIKGATK
jgi:multidrug efflux system membrane fusion protein